MTTPRIEEIVEKFREEFEADRGYGQVPQYVPAHYDFRDYEHWLRQALTEAHQSGIDEAVEIVKKMQIQKPEHKGSEFSTPRDYHWRGYYAALDETIKALQDNK